MTKLPSLAQVSVGKHHYFNVLLLCIANLNDRSMLGDRDSEVAIILEDKELVQIVLMCYYVCVFVCVCLCVCVHACMCV